MAKGIARNEPCPCGSGKKYKHCHLGKKQEPQSRRPAWLFPAIAVVLALVIGIVVGLRAGIGQGLAWGAGALIIFGLVALGAPPPRSGGKGGDPAAINFGG